MAQLITYKSIRKMIDTKGNEYIIHKKPNNHYELVKFNDGKGQILATTKISIFNTLKEIYNTVGLKEIKN